MQVPFHDASIMAPRRGMLPEDARGISGPSEVWIAGPPFTGGPKPTVVRQGGAALQPARTGVAG